MDRKHGFTLVELLVVITIIGMLVALLIPAVISARERARQAVCVNRLKELATATLHYESVKGQLPGWRNQAPLRDSAGNPAQISWVVALFPYLGREDLWNEWRNGGDGATAVVYEQVVCPSDMANLSNTAPMNYVANRQLFRDRSTTALAAQNNVTLERLPSSQRTVMISERAHRSGTPPTPGPWTRLDEERVLVFDWSTGADVYALGLNTNEWGISSNHSGIVHMAFADGHVEALPPEMETALYEDAGP